MRLLRIGAVLLAGVALVQLMSQPRIAQIIVSKSERTLWLLDPDGTAVRTYPIVLGRNLDGSKEREGDQRTPEGEYFVCVKNPKSRFHLSLGINYPNTADAQRGLAAGLITEEHRAAIEDAERLRQRPPWDTPLGGEIFIHGRGDGREGTRGCVAVSDAAIEEIFALVDTGTPVVIRP